MYSTKTITKTVPTDLIEIDADWNKAVVTGKYRPMPHEVTKNGERLWNDFGINSKFRGTIDMMVCHKPIFDYITMNILDNSDNNMLHFFGKMYFEDLKKCKISFFIDKVKYKVNIIDPLLWNSISIENKQEHTLEVWKQQSSDNIFAYYKNKRNTMVYLDTYTNIKNPTTNSNYPLNDCKLLGSITIKSVYDKEWMESDRDKAEFMGGIYIQRVKKIIDHFKIPAPTSGDFERRDYITHSRHLINFDSSLDKEFQVQVNKSHIKENDINTHLYKTIKNLTTEFSKYLFSKNRRNPIPNPDPLPPIEPLPQPSPKPIPDLIPPIEPLTQPSSKPTPLPKPAIEPNPLPTPSIEPDLIPPIEPDLVPTHLPTPSPPKPMQLPQSDNFSFIIKSNYLNIYYDSVILVRINTHENSVICKKNYMDYLAKMGKDTFIAYMKEMNDLFVKYKI
jgi:hypothetical protein